MTILKQIHVELLLPHFHHSMLMDLHLFDFFLWSTVHGLATCSYTILQSPDCKDRICSLSLEMFLGVTLCQNKFDYILSYQLLTVAIN